MILFYFLFFVLFQFFMLNGGYYFFLKLFSLLFKKNIYKKNDYIPVSVIIPTYNEEKVLYKKLKNISEQQYPCEMLQIIVVDSGSTDKTIEIAENFKDYKVEIVKQHKREGKGAAINYALNSAKFDIVAVTDANAYLGNGSLKKIIDNFHDKTIGGVTGKYCGILQEDNLVSAGSALFRNYENSLRIFETEISSAVSLYGELCVTRKEFAKADILNLTEDFDISVGIVEKGYRLVCEKEAEVFEAMPTNKEDVFVQKKRVIIGTIQTLFKHKNVLFNPKYGWYGLFILPMHKLVPVLAPFIYLSALVGILFIFKNYFIIFFTIFLISIFLIFCLSRKAFEYFVILNWCCLCAWKDYFSKKYSVLWKKMESSR